MNIARYIDHTLLKPSATTEQIMQLCNEAIEHNFYSVCVNPCNVALCHKNLHGTNVKICAVIGFPLGANSSHVKELEARLAIEDGADELDMVLNIGYFLSGEYLVLVHEMFNISEYAHRKNTLVKVIIETGLLTDEQKIMACEYAVNGDADFVKTCTGFSGGQATIEDVKLMKETVGNQVQVKASGGIRDYTTALAMIRAGASRIGTSSGIKIVAEEKETIAKQ